MVSVVKTPQGHKIIDQAIDAFIGDASGDAVVVFDYHSLTTGDYIYVTSDIDEYNGFWYVEVASYREFQLKEHADADLVEYYQDADIEYYRTQPHDWSSIFLPIVYKITNNRWPLNTADTARTVSSQADDNGFTELTLSGDLKAEGANMLEFLKIADAPDAGLNNIWQIVEMVSPSIVVINLPYSVLNSFSGALVQYYYNNYQVRVKVWAGLNALHPWADKKPYEEMAELSLTPDENNEVMFSISDYIKSKVQVKNNLTLFSLPLNLDAFTGFYIQTAESYDDSDNYSLATVQTSFSTDTFEGYAIAGKLPFKNTYSGDYAEYVLTSGSPARWLTNADRLLAVEDLYFDISFIKNIRGAFQIIIDKYLNDALTATETQSFLDNGIGVYRIPIVPDIFYDHFCVRAYTPGVAATSGPPVTTLEALTGFANFGGATWTLGANPTISCNGSSGVTGWLNGDIVTTGGYDYEFTVAIDIDPPDFYLPISEVVYALMTVGGLVIDSVTYNYVVDGTFTETFTLHATEGGQYLAIYVTNHTPFATKNYTIISAAYNAPTPVDDSIPAQVMTEEICIDILETCEAQQGFSEEDRRLLEDGDFRLLE